MSNSTCSITSIGDLLDKGDRNLLNVTTTIASCPDVCSLAWGKGNPDLSGIGLNISYIMQAVLAVLCGPILALIYSFRDGLGLDEGIQDRLSEIHHSFINISAGFNIPVALAAVIRIRQYAPFFEQYFLLFLVGMQLCSFVNVVCAVSLFYKHHRRSVWTIPLYLGIQGVLLFITFILMRNITKRVTIKELIEGCKSYGQVLPFFVDATKQTSEPILYQIVQWFMIAIFALPFSLGVLFSFKMARRLLLGERMGRIWVVIAVLLMIMTTTIMMYLTWFLQTMRSRFKEITGGAFQDDQWGFGQVIAVFLWIPLCLQVVYCAIYFAWSRFRMNSGRRVQWIRDVVNRIIGVFKDDQDENDNPKRQLQLNSRMKVQNRGEYLALT